MSEQQKLDQLRRIEEELKCIICSKLMDDAHSLMCGHNFCGVCLQQWFHTNKCCPTCRTPALKQPIQNITIQKLVDIVWPANLVHDPRLQRADWLALYPVQNQGPYIVDRDQDGTTYRCSNCAWELDEEFFCGQCLVQFDYDREAHPRPLESESDTQSFHEDEEDLEDFVVSDDQVDYDDHTSNLPLEVYDEDGPMELNNISSDDDSQSNSSDLGGGVRNQGIKRRRIQIDEDEDEDGDDLLMNSDNRSVLIQESEVEEDYEEEEDLEDPFPRNKYIDDYASEDEDESVEEKATKKDTILDSISKARTKMENNLIINTSTSIQDSSSEANSDGEAPDYDFSL